MQGFPDNGNRCMSCAFGKSVAPELQRQFLLCWLPSFSLPKLSTSGRIHENKKPAQRDAWHARYLEKGHVADDGPLKISHVSGERVTPCTEYYRVVSCCIMLYHVVSCTINTVHMIRSCHRAWQLHSGSWRDPAASRTNHSLLLGCHEIKSLHFLNSHVPFIFLRSVRIQIEASWFAG